MILQANALNMPLQGCSVDAIVTDPPYGLEFMGKEWDKLSDDAVSKSWNTKGRSMTANPKRQPNSPAGRHSAKISPKPNPRCRKCGRVINGADTKKGFVVCHCKQPEIYMPNTYAVKMQKWHTQWLTEAYRVLKPGGSMLVMGGTRTFHRLMCAIEDSGFIIKDTLMWIYGSGFPKAQDLGKMIDKRNGRDAELRKELALYIREAIRKKGITLRAIRIQLNHKMKGGGLIPHWITEDSQPTVPTKKDWLKLKEILDLDNKWDWFIEREEAEREKIGEKETGDPLNWYANMDTKPRDGILDITTPSTDLAKHWDGFKVGGIKPAYEPIVWAVKPPEGSYMDNVLKWGVGAVNVDECRIGSDKGNGVWGSSNKTCQEGRVFNASPDGEEYKSEQNSKGRFPANIILSHHPECVQVGMKRVKGKPSDYNWKESNNDNPSHITRNIKSGVHYGDETVESWQCHPDCPVKVMDEQSGVLHARGDIRVPKTKRVTNNTYFGSGERTNAGYTNDSGGASRFFYCAKASRSERNAGLQLSTEPIVKHNARPCDWEKADWSKRNINNHPTVKPIALFEWLIKLVTREGQTVLDPFLGSGTTAISAHNTGRKCIGIEKEGEYIEIAKRRVEHHESQPRQMEIGA